MFEWVLEVEAASTGHRSVVDEWTTDYVPSDAELKGRMNAVAEGDKVAILSVAFAEIGFVSEVFMTTGRQHALAGLGYPLPGHVLV